MVKKKNNKKKKGVSKRRLKLVQKKKTFAEKIDLKNETVHFSIAIILIFISIFLFAAAFKAAGPIGDVIYKKLEFFLGIGYYLIPTSFFILAIAFFKDIKKNFSKIKLFGVLLFLISGLGFIELIFEKGGWLGSVLSGTQEFVGSGMSVILSLIGLVISQVIIFDGIPQIAFLKKKNKNIYYNDELSEEENRSIDKTAESTIKSTKTKSFFSKNKDVEEFKDAEDKEEKKVFKISSFEKGKSKKEGEKMTEKIKQQGITLSKNNIKLPPVNLLSKDKGKANAGDVKENAHIIKSTLASFGIRVEIDAVSVGPTVTRYSLRPATGVRVSKIAALKDDMALALSAKSIIIQTPIPGQSLVGIEIPNKNKTMVGAGGLFSSPEYINSKFELPLAIGKDIAGKTTVIGMEETPHMLIAGATGAGKSVTVHAIINSMLYKHGPDTLKFILVDPKRVEMTLYNGIPHLLTPVIIDPKKAILSLRWAISEMERRYEILEKYGIRDIKSYHKNILSKSKNNTSEDTLESMPYIVIVIDELSDIMQQYPKELEAGIVSIAQKARAVGIHLILSTQRPSVNVVTGLIKANVPTRLALQVSSAIDSKTILDQGGAENLLGKGDMLYTTGSMAKPIRVQSSFISEDEVKKVVSFIKKSYKDILGEEITLGDSPEEAQTVVAIGNEIEFDDEDFNADPMLSSARDEVIASGKASTSYLQRRLGIGYGRAAKLIDILEEKGVVGPPNGSKAREVLVENSN